jgi:hypothetical protein
MANTFEVVRLMVIIGLVPYLLVVLMPSWRALAVCVLIVGGGFATIWLQHLIVTQSPHYKERLADALGLAIFAVAAMSFGAGTMTRIVSLAVAHAGGSFGRALAINTAGFALFVALMAAPGIWGAWQRRPPPEACAKAFFSLDMARARLRVPASRLFNVYLGPTALSDAYYLGLAPSLRAFCTRTEDGMRPARATSVWLNLGSNYELYGLTCEAARLGDAGFCTALPAIQRGRIDETDYPIEAYAFAPDEVRMGDFASSRSTYDDSREGASAQDEFFRSERLTPDGKPLTFKCYGQTNGGYFCRASHAWRDGIHIDFRFRASRADLIAKGERVDVTTRDLFERMVAPVD